jgi:penicillin amidase
MLVLTLVVIAGVGAYLTGHFKGFLFTVVGLVVLLLLLIAGVYLYARRSIPTTKGVLRVEGLSAVVEIIRDSDYIPHIYAQNKREAYWGLGYAHAQDRLWQIEFQRRSSQGRVAEILGPRLLPLDRFMRTLGMHRCAPKVWESLSKDARDLIEAYVAGINAFIAEHAKGGVAPEFALLRFKPQPWTGVDVVLMSKMLAWSLGGTYVTELLRNDLIEVLGAERARQLLPDYFRDEPSPSLLQETPKQEATVLPNSTMRSSALDPGTSKEEGVGSNMWVVESSRSATGKPVLANDPHLMSSIPMTWYLAHLSAPDFDVIGATIPGIPGVIIGRNRNIAWGVTNLNPDVQDLFKEKIDAEGQSAQFLEEEQPLELITETIRIKKRSAVQIQVRVTRHGPLISDVIDANNAELPMAGRRSSGSPLALQWTGLKTADSTLETFLLLNEARDWGQFTEALKHLVAPAVNFGYADNEGNIGYHAAGQIPIRNSGDGSVPAEGWSGEGEWVGFIPFEELPSAYNPSQGYIVSTNNSPAAPHYPHFLGADWVEPYRKQRITELLNDKERLAPDDHAAIQGDSLSMQARESLPLLLSLVSPRDAEMRKAVELLAGWDRDAEGASIPAAIFAAWWMKLPRVLLGEELDKKLLASYEGWSTYVNRFVLDSLSGRVPTSTEPSKLAERALREALDELKGRLGDEMQNWRWDRLHRAVFPHYPFHNVPFLQKWFSRSVPRGGDWSTVNFGAVLSARPFIQRNVPGYRQIIDLAQPDGGLFIHSVGQSGHFLSPHYDDYLKDWAAVRYRPMRFTRAAVERDARATLRLTPKALHASA